MQLKTSCFNGSIFRKNVSRFWPIWGSYFAAWLVMLPIILMAGRHGYAEHPGRVQEYVLNMGLYGGLIMGGVYAIFSVMAVWSFAYQSRAAHGMACLPVRREGVFCSLTLAGLLPLLLANAAVFALTLLAEAACGCVDAAGALQCLALMTLPLLLFYGFATFCAQLTGHILALPAVYVVLNFVFVGGEMLVRAILRLFVYGCNMDLEAFALKWLSPVVAILMRCSVSPETVWYDGIAVASGRALVSGWNVLILYAVAGVVFLTLALLLFRRRRMETAGDVVAVAALKPVFRWCMALGCALCLSCLCYVLFWDNQLSAVQGMCLFLAMTLIMFLGALLGWFIAEMLLKKSFRVFRRGWGGFGACILLIAGLMCAAEFDLFGYEKYVPADEKVEVVTVWSEAGQATLSEPESIALTTAMHRSIAANKAFHERLTQGTSGSEGLRTTSVQLMYTLRSGRVVAREYDLKYDINNAADYGDAGLLQDVINCGEAVRDRKETGFPLTKDNITAGTVSGLLPATVCAAVAGYDDVEDYLLREVYHMDQAELDAMTEDERHEMVMEVVKYNAVPTAQMEKEYGPAAMSTTEYADTWVTGRYEDLDLSKVLLQYEWRFNSAQLAELFNDCIAADIADGTLGRVWLICDEQYRETVYTTYISIDARPYVDGGTQEEDAYWDANFFTTPTVNSARTNAWLTAHGVKQYTLAETNALQQ